jgi:Flp pilus assembly protein TadD
VLAALGRWDRARLDLEEAVASGANDWMILNALAWLYADHYKTEFARAAELAQLAIDAQGSDFLVNDESRATALLTLGVAYLGLGQLDDARAALGRAAELSPSNAEILARLDLARGGV